MADLLAIHRHAVRARLLDERLTQLARAGRIGFHPDARGFEPALAAAVLSLREDDAVFPSARDHAALLARGYPIARYVAHAFGSAEDPAKGHAAPGHLGSRELRVATPSGLVSNHMTHATGYAWAAKLRGERAAVLTLFAESAADAGDFHSAVNFAGATGAPIVFLCRTDRSRSERTPAPIERVADKGIAYGVPGVVCSADDAEAVAQAVAQALARAYEGQGPTLIEAIRESSADPLEALEARLSSEGRWNAHQAIELRRELMTEIESAVTQAQQAGPPSRETIFDDVYARLPGHLEDQRAALLTLPEPDVR